MKWIVFVFFILPFGLFADSTDPWWDSNWHYRAELNINTAVIDQTGKLDIDFAALGLPSVLDENSIRIVKSDGVTLLIKQEFTDVLYGNATDTLNNDRGEVKFIIEESGTVRYYIYYDTTANGSKTPLSASYVINGNFEHSSVSTPTAWVTGQADIGTNAPNNEVHSTGGEGTIVSVTDANYGTSNVVNTAHTGDNFHLHGYRSFQESSNRSESVWLERTFTVPSSNAGNLTFWFNVQGWDQATNNGSYDRVQISENGTIINPQTLNIVNTSLQVLTQVYGKKSTYSQYEDTGWTQATLDLSTYTGNSITIRISYLFAGDNISRTWQQVDDFEWSIKIVTLGIQETLPNMSLSKISCVINGPINGAINPKRIPGATIRYAIEVHNTGGSIANSVIVDDLISTDFNFGTIINLQIDGNNGCDCLSPVAAGANGANGGVSGNNVKLDFDTVSAGATECGYFEVNIE